MSKRNTIICAAEKCYSSLLSHPSKSFFGFPSDDLLCQTWLKNCGRTDLNIVQVNRGHYRLCEDHFEEKWFTDSSRQLLQRKLNPVPTIFVNNINSLLRTRAETQFINDYCHLNAADLLSVEINEEEDEPSEGAVDSEETSPTEQLTLSNHTKTKQIANKHTKESKNLKTKDLRDMNNICRLCMNEVSLSFIDLFSKSKDAEEILKVIGVILPNKVSICDGLPHKVCEKCVIDLKTLQRLIGQFQEVDNHLRNIVRASVENGNSTEIYIGNEGTEKGVNVDFNNSTPKHAVVLASSPDKIIERSDSCGYLIEINTDKDFGTKNNLDVCKHVTTDIYDDHIENSNWQVKRTYVKSKKEVPANCKKSQNSFINDVKIHRKYKKRRIAAPGDSTTDIGLLNQLPPTPPSLSCSYEVI